MKKTNFQFWLLGALLCGLSLSVTSCKDDDKNDLSPEEQEKQALEQAEKEMMAFNVLDYLADMSNAPEDYLTGSYEPTIGVADGGNISTRIVNTNDMATAAMRFADMVGASIDENTSEYTWSDDKVGTLTYTKTNDGKSWATVDVNIKQIPHLQKIIYRSPAQADNNGKFDGTAYYRFGDVVKKKNADGEDEFWICVRPAFGPEGKETSHWVTVCPLPKANLFTYKGSNGIDYALPTKLGDNHEQSKNFAEMLFAIFFPQEWENNIINTKGISMFHDFDKENIMYHRQYFWTRVQKAWTDPNALTNAYGNPSGISLLKSLFGTDGTPEYFKTMLKSADGLNLLTNGYSWNTTFSNKPTLYRYRFVNGTGTESNMHMEPIKHDFLKNYHSVTAEVIKAKIKLNCITDYSDLTPGWSVSQFFGTENKHYIIRHATGAELSTDKKEDAKQPLKGVTEVYRYNKRYKISNLDEDPEVLTSSKSFDDEQDIEDDGAAVRQEEIKVGYYFAADGNIYKTKTTCERHGGAQAVVVSLCNDLRVEDDQVWNGLAMALLKTETVWDQKNDEWWCNGMDLVCPEIDDALSRFNGIAYTECMTKCEKQGHDHEHITMSLSVYDELKTSDIVRSSWFVPSLGQFLLAIEGLGGKYNAETQKFELPNNDAPYFVELKKFLSDEKFMTSTPDNDEKLYSFQLGTIEPTFKKDVKTMMVPFIAFRYNGGAGHNQNR